jgi:hypothetical protein
MKRDILTFAGKVSRNLPKPDRKFAADITYGILASGSCLLTDVAGALHEKSKKKNTVERLSLHLAGGVPKAALKSYLGIVKKSAPANPVIHIDDTDVAKGRGRKFESIGRVRDGSKSRGKNVFADGYHVTEATVLMGNRHPASFFSQVHSSAEGEYVSANAVTFSAIARGVKLFPKATYVMDSGYDSNKMFLCLDSHSQDYVIRLSAKRKVVFGNKWMPVTELCNRRKGKIKMSLNYKGKEREAYLTHVKCRITASRKDICLVLVYGISEHPMMLATNKPVLSKGDVEGVARLYFSRWRIEEYFRAKKQLFGFEGFRVRSLRAINALNFYVTVCMAYLGHMSLKPENSGLKAAAIKAADPVKGKVLFSYYRLAKGIRAVLAPAREGARLWFRTKRPRYRQLWLKLVI